MRRDWCESCNHLHSPRYEAVGPLLTETSGWQHWSVGMAGAMLLQLRCPVSLAKETHWLTHPQIKTGTQPHCGSRSCTKSTGLFVPGTYPVSPWGNEMSQWGLAWWSTPTAAMPCTAQPLWNLWGQRSYSLPCLPTPKLALESTPQ